MSNFQVVDIPPKRTGGGTKRSKWEAAYQAMKANEGKAIKVDQNGQANLNALRSSVSSFVQKIAKKNGYLMRSSTGEKCVYFWLEKK